MFSGQLARRRGPARALVRCGHLPRPNIASGHGYQTSFAARIKTEADILVGTVGAITDAFQAEHILRTEQADGIFIARAAH